jgi:hypothetical protein
MLLQKKTSLKEKHPERKSFYRKASANEKFNAKEKTLKNLL